MNRPANIPDEFWTLLDAACDGELAAADSDTAAADRRARSLSQRQPGRPPGLRRPYPLAVASFASGGRGTLAPGGLGSGRSSER